MVDQISLFKRIGLTEQKAKETIKNQVLGKKLEGIVLKAISISGDSIDKPVGVLLYTLASSSLNDDVKITTATEYVSHGKIKTVQQLNAAVDYLKCNVSQLDVSKFEEACGVNITHTPEQIETAVEEVLKSHKNDILAKRYHFNVGMLIGEVSRNLKWVDTKKVKLEIDMQLLDILGPKTEADKLPIKKGEKKVKEKKEVKKEEKAVLSIEDILKIIDPKNIYRTGEAAKFHKPGENHKTDGYEMTKHTKDLMDQHVKEYGLQVRTRFPPEPNGILHIGHAKAINFNFGYAKANNGVTFLRYDDTNPEKEEERFFRGISDMVEWLGFKPFQITHASDYFDELYHYAVELIKRGGAYVCHQQQNEIQGHNPPPSPWRERPIHESLQLFEDMKSGILDEGTATVRMKVVMEDGKMDPVAYRIKFTPHPRTGDKWCIYPTYDFTHCLNDSLEHITHSLCTKEFQSRRSSYYWLCNSLDVYCPVQWEYSRLNLNYAVVSKRKIAKLIDNKIVADWDDPRLYTLSALRRRGFPPEAINYFCAKIGVTMSQTTLDPSVLDSCVRDVLNVTANRAMAVLDPLKVVITNFNEDEPITVEVPNIPNNPSAGSHVVPFSKVIYIDRTDFRENSDASYKRLTTTQNVGLRHAGRIIGVEEILKDDNGKVTELRVSCKSSSAENKPKAFIQWVSNPIQCELRLYNQLFLHSNPEDAKEVPGGFLSDINPDSLDLVENAYVDVSVKNAKPRTCFQFERVGYFAVDEDTTQEKMVFNRTVPLKEDAGKNI